MLTDHATSNGTAPHGTTPTRTAPVRSQFETPPATPIDGPAFWPKPPQTVEESGLMVPFVEDRLVRLLYFGQQLTGGPSC
jgi:hypothetical protein